MGFSLLSVLKTRTFIFEIHSLQDVWQGCVLPRVQEGDAGWLSVLFPDAFLALHGVGHAMCSNQAASDSRRQLMGTESPVTGTSFSGHTQ